MKVAIQGEIGSFSHEAAMHLVPNCTIVACARSAEVFDRVERASVACAVIPIENSLAGPVSEHYDLLLARKAFIQKESLLRIVHNVIAAKGVKFADVRRVYSHPIALDQCREFFHTHPDIEPTPFYDTAGSVKHVVENNLRDAAGLAGVEAAQAYEGKILKRGVEDSKQNYTRFFLIRKTRRILPAANKTSLVFGLKNVAGALFTVLGIFADRGINLSKIESRPLRGHPWEYVFYVDFLSGDDSQAREAIRHLAKQADMVKILGIYPAA